ncbi:unnamed protein product [Camellia sinensis]
MISKKPSSFQSGTPLNSWQNLIYSAVPIKLETIADHHSQRDIENPTDCFISSVVDDVPLELENIAKPHSGGDIKNPIDCLIYDEAKIAYDVLESCLKKMLQKQISQKLLGYLHQCYMKQHRLGFMKLLKIL